MLLDNIIGGAGVLMATVSGAAMPLAQEPAGGMSIMQAIGTAGMVGGMLLVFVWWSRQDKVELAKKLNDTEAYVKDRLDKRLEDNTRVIQSNSDALERNSQVIERLVDRIEQGAEVRVRT